MDTRALREAAVSGVQSFLASGGLPAGSDCYKAVEKAEFTVALLREKGGKDFYALPDGSVQIVKQGEVPNLSAWYN